MARQVSISNLNIYAVGDLLLVRQAGDTPPRSDSSPARVAEDFLLWLEENLPIRGFVSVDELGLLYHVFCSRTLGGMRYQLSPAVLKHMAFRTRKMQKEIREGEKRRRNIIHYLVGSEQQSERR